MISAIELGNFKCFRATPVNFSHLTILAGANGAGKSTVIQALLLIRQAIEKIQHRDFSITDGEIREVRVNLNGTYGIALGNSQAVISANTDAEIFYLQVNVNEAHYPFVFSSPITRPEQSISISNINEVKEIYSLEQTGSIFSSEFSYLAAERLGPRVTQDIPSTDTITTGVSGEYVGYALHKAATQHIDRLRCLDTHSSTLFSIQLEAWLDLIMPGVQVKPRIYEEIGKVNIGIRKRISETDYLIPSNIGFGISYVLPIIVAGLTAAKDSMLIIENPEAHLHPAGQTSIGKFLAKVAGSGVQVIVETHSEHIINGARIAVLEQLVKPESLLVNYFDSETSEPQVHPININSKGELSSWPPGFFDQQEKDLSSIFQLRKNA